MKISIRNLKSVCTYFGGIVLTVALGACGGGSTPEGGASSGAGAKNLPPALKANVQTAVVKTGVVQDVPTSLTPEQGQSGFRISSDQATTLPIGKIFIYQGTPYKVIGVNHSEGIVYLTVETAALDEVFDDLKLEIVSHAVQYDDAEKPITLAQTGLIKRAAMQLGLVNAITGLKNCVSLDDDFTTTNAAKENEFGYEFGLACSLGELTGVSALNAVTINGNLEYSGKDTRIIDLKNKTDYQENDGTMSANLSLKFEPADTATLNTLASKTNKCKAQDDELVCELAIYEAPTRSGVALAGGVAIPYTINSGIKISLTIGGSGEVKLDKWETTWTHVAGVKDNKDITSSLPKKSEYARFTEPSIEGEVDLYLQGYMGAMVGFEGASVVGAVIDGGLYANAAGELGSSAGSRCVSVEPGFRLGVESKFLTFGDNSLLTASGKSNYPFKSLSKSWPAECGIHRKVKFDYVIRGKDLYQVDTAASTDGVDAYIASYDLFHKNNRPVNIVLDLASTSVTDGYTLGIEAEMMDHSKNAVAIIQQSPSNSDSKYLYVAIQPGDTSYGDTISLRVNAYIQGLRDTTMVTRIVKIKIEDALSATPTYSKEITTDGREYWRVDHNYGGAARSLLTNAQNTSSVGGTTNIGKDNGYYWFDAIINSENGNIPSQLVLKSAATSRGKGQAFNYVEFNTPTHDSIEMEPASPEVGDVITFTVKGNGFPADYVADIPNCLWVVEKRTPGNISNKNYSTLERVFQCKNTAAGTNLVAKFGPDEFPMVFSVGAQTSTDFSYSPKSPKLGDTVQFWLRNVWSRVQSVAWTLYSGASAVVTEVSNGATTYWDSLVAPYFTPGTQNVVVAYKDDAGTTLRTRTYQFELATGLAAPVLTISGKTQTSVSLGWTAVSGASYYALTRTGGVAAATQSVVGVSYTDANASAGESYSYSIKACNATACSVASTAVAVTTDANASLTTSKLPHTGITTSQCYEAGSSTLVGCASAGAIALNSQQDGMRTSVNSMSYSLVGSYSKEECVKDNVTGLIWEGKSASGLRAGSNTYTNYHIAYYGTQEQMDAPTNTYGYAKAVNDTALCGFTDWRLPTVDELQSIVDYSVPYPGPTINTTWFPNTPSSTYYSASRNYWTSSPYVSLSSLAWYVNFDSTGNVYTDVRNSLSQVRLVRSSQ